MLVGERMAAKVRIIHPDDTLEHAARAMAEMDADVLPVGENDRLVGMITDRDVAIRCIAQGLPPDTRVRDVMSTGVLYCFDDDDVEDVLDNMAETRMRCMAVLNRDKRLIGIITVGGLAGNGVDTQVGEALGEIAPPSGRRSQPD